MARRRSLLERWGTRVLRRGLVRSAPGVAEGVHVLSDAERAEIATISRRGVRRAAVAGALAGVVSALAAVVATPLLGPDPEDASWTSILHYRAATLAVIGVASLVEIAFLYVDMLRTVRDLANAAGLHAAPESGVAHDPAAYLARTALEFPNPLDDLPGVAPLRESSKLVIVALTLVYKGKVATTGFILRAILRRLLGRLATRAVLAFVAVPVTAAWDALACWFVLREARMRVTGPSAAEEIVDAILADGELKTDGGAFLSGTADLLARAVGAAIVRSRDLHPNLVALLAKLERACPGADLAVIDDSEAFLRVLGEAAPAQRRAALRMLIAAAVLDGRVARRERDFVARAAEQAGLTLSLEHVDSLRAAFVAGTARLAREVHEVVPDPSRSGRASD